MNSNERISKAFQRIKGRPALVPYVTAGDPSIAATPVLMHALVKAGADILELGIPFSDPMADGPVIQRAAERAVKRGVGLRDVLDMVAVFRQADAIAPVVLMGYANPIERRGQASFVDMAGKAGIDGILVVDYPPEEISEFADLLHNAQIDPIFLLAPTSTDERMKMVGKVARGYVYYVSLKGVTGAGNIDIDDVASRIERIRQHVSIPVGVGFGIRDAESARRLGECADAVVIGSKLIETMETAVVQAHNDGKTTEQADQAAIDAAANWLQSVRDNL